MRKKFLLTMLTLLFVAMGSSGKLFAQELLVNCDYNSSTEGWGTTKFSNYASAYAYATTNAKRATIVIEKTNTLSGNTFDNNHKNYSNLKVVIKDGATMGNALSKWDMTYPVTVEPGGTLTCARPASASVSNVHIKNTLTVGEDGSTKKAYVNFLSDSYQDCDISIRYNGKILVYSADFKVQDLDAQGTLTIKDSDVTVDGAFASAISYKTTLTNSTIAINGNQISGGLSDFSGGDSNQFGNLTLNKSTITIENGNTKVAANVTATNSKINVENLTINNGKTLNLNDGSTLDAENITVNGTGSVKIDGEAAPIIDGAMYVPVSGFAALKAAVEAGKNVQLTANITTTSAIVTSGVTSVIDLNNNTLTIGAGDNKFNDESNITIKNGDVNIDGVTVQGNAIFCLDEYENTLVSTVTLDNVNLVGENYSSAYGVFYIGKSSVLNVNGGVWNLLNDEHEAGGVFKADASGAKLNIDGLNLTAHNVRRVVTHANTTIENSTMTISGDAEGVDAEMEHGFNRSPLAISNSTITMKDMVGRGITAQNGVVTISENSYVNITNCIEATIDVRNNQTVTIDNTSTVFVDKEPILADGCTINGTVKLPTVAMIGTTEYYYLADALEAAKSMTGDVTVEICAKVTMNQPLAGSYTSIKFVGLQTRNNTDAEIYLDVQGYITATGKKVAFENLKLSKSEGSFIANAGFMNVAFGIYDVAEVSYTNCTFSNGSYASSGKVTYTGCTFYRSHDKYGLWAYGNVEAIVEGCTFADYRGIKMYAENGADANTNKPNLTVKITDFSAVDNKPAIVLTYGESVTLENNTYSLTGVFELDLDGEPNGVAVTSDVAPTCVNDNGACGVLVDDKIYTTVAQAAKVAKSGSKVTLLHDSTETVALPMGVILDKNGFEAAGVTVLQPGDVEKSGTWGGIDWTLTYGGTLTIKPTAGEPVPDANAASRTYEVGAWREAVRYNSKGEGVAIEGWPYDRSKVKTLVIEEGVISIGSFAAQSFTNLTGEVEIPSTVKYIGQEAFQKSTMTKLTFAPVPEGETGEELCIAQGAFKNLIIEEVSLPADRPVHLHAWVFNNCHNLKNVYMPATVVSVHGTNHLDYFKDFNAHSNPTWTKASEIFAYNENMETVTFGSEEVMGMFYANNNGTNKDYFKANVGLVTYCDVQDAIAAAAESGNPISLIKNTNTGSEDNKLEIPAGETIIIDLKGKEMTGSILAPNANLTVKNGTIKNTNKDVSAIEINKGTLNIENVNINSARHALRIDGEVTATINGGTYKSAQGTGTGTYHAANISGNANVTINGGTFVGPNGNATTTADSGSAINVQSGASVIINNGTYKGGKTKTLFSEGKLVLYGGKYDQDPTAFVAENYMAEQNTEGLFEVVETIAKIGETPYASLQAAINAVQNNQTITILADTISEGTIKLPATLKNVTIKGAEGAILKDMKITSADGNSINYEGLKFDGITFDNSNVVLTGWRNNGAVYKNIAVNGCTFKNLSATNTEAAFHINCGETEAVNGFTFTNNVIDNLTGGSKSGIYAQVTGEVKVENNVINNVQFRPYVIQVTTDDGIADNFTVKGNTFSGSAVGRAQGLGNNAEGTDNVNIVVSNNIFKGITNAQQICYWNFNAAKTTADLSGNYYDIDILANPGKIYYNSAADNTGDLVEMGVFPIYTELDENGTINKDSAYTPDALAKIGEKDYYSLQDAIDAVQNGETITLTADITEEVTLTEKTGLTYTIDGDGKTMKGTITVNSLSDTNDNRRITVKNIIFVDTADANVDFISSVNTNHYPRLTIEGCTFTGSGNDGDVAVRLKSSHSVVIKGCTGTGLHSFLQNTSGWNLTIENVKVTNSKSGLALGTVQGVKVKGCEIAVASYGIRMDAQYNNNAVIESNKVNAFIPVVVRKAEVNSKMTFQGTNTFTVSNTDGLWCAIGTSEYETSGTMPTAATGRVKVVLKDTGLAAAGIYGNFVPVAKIGEEEEYATLEAAFKAATSGCTIDIISDVTVDTKWDCRYAGAKFTVPVTINGNGKTIKFTNTVNDNNWNTIFRFEENATVNNLIVDIENATGAQRVITAKKSLNVDGLNIVGIANYGIIFGEGASATDLAAAEIVVENSTLRGTRAISDNANGKDVKSVVIENNTLNGNAYISASESIKFNKNTANGEVDLRSYTAENVLSVVAKENTLKEGVKNYIYAKTIDAQEEFTTENPPLKVSNKAELDAALAAAKEGNTITLTADIDYGTTQLAITKAITLDLGGKTLTTQNGFGGMSVKNNPTIKNGTIVHKSNTAAIKVWNATAFEDLVIDVQGKGDANKTIGGIVLQSGSLTRVGSIKNVTIEGAALTNGIETYNCGDATENVIGSMENVTIDAVGTGMLISAPCGTATNCNIKGGVNGIEIWIKGNYSASLNLVDCDVVGGVFAHDEFSSNPDIVNNGTLSFTADEATTGTSVEDVTLTIARAENVEGVLAEVIEKAEAKIGDTYYITLAKAIETAKAGETVTVLEGTYAVPTMKAGIAIVGEGNVVFEGTLSGTLENLTMNNIHIKGANAQRWAYAKGNLLFENVTFEATSVYAIHFDGIAAGTNLTYKDCTIIGWAAMGGSPASCKFEGCTIKGNGTYGVIRTYFDATITDCTFDVDNVNDNDNYEDGIHAVDGAKVTVTNCTNVNGNMKDLVNVHANSVVTVDGVAIKNVVIANDKYYRTLAEAFAANNNGTVTLLDNIDLAGTEWEPVSFGGTFDGNGKTISNLTINKPGVSNTGFIKSLNGTVKNVTFTNPTVTGGENTAVVAGRAGGSAALAENITINGTIKVETTHSGYARAAAIVGGWAYGNYKDITVDGGDKDNSYIKHTGGGDGRYVAGIVGHADDVNSYVNCTVKNITISGGWLCGGIAGPGPAEKSAIDCSVENINMHADYSGGMFGWYYGAGTIENATIKNVTFTDGSTNNGVVGGYGHNTDATVTNLTFENVQNSDGKPLLDHVASIGDNHYFTLADAIATIGNGDVTINLLRDVTLDYNARDEYGNEGTTSVTINGNNHTLTLNQKNSDWASIGLVNGKLVLNNITIEKTGYGDTSGTWNTHAIIFSCPLEMTNVTVNNGIAVQAGATLNNVTINEANGYYGLWINGNGQEVTMNGGSITATNGGRGIKIADQYVDAPAKVTLNVDGTVFETAKKAAVLVSSTAGAKITASNVNIEKVEEDKVNFVWVDEDWAANFGNVEVTGATVAQESIDSFVAAISKTQDENTNIIIAYYKTFPEAIAAVRAGETIELFADVEATEVILLDKSITINGNDHNVTSSATRVFRVTTSNTEVTLNDVNMVSSAKVVYPNDVRGISIDIVDNVKLTLNNSSVDFTDASANDWAYAVNVTGGDNHVVTVNGGTYEGANVINVRGANNTVTVKDAVITSTYPNNNQYYGACIWVLQNQGSSVEATGNTFNGNNAVAFNLGTGTTLTESNNIDNTTRIIAKIGDKYYTLQEAIDAAGITDTITIMASFSTDDYYTIAAGQNITLDLNGKTITGTDKTEKNFGLIQNNGTLTIVDNGSRAETGTLKLTATVNNGWNRYSAVISNNPGGTLTVNGGLIQHLGGTDMAYGIDNLTNGNLGDVNCTINGGTILSTYRAIRQFLNSDSKENNLVINGGTIQGENKAIFFHDPSTKANKGALIVGNNAKVNSAYLYVTPNSVEWPVTVSIPQAAIATIDAETYPLDGVISANVPDGYDVANQEGVWGVYEIIDKAQSIDLVTGWKWVSLFVDATEEKDLDSLQTQLGGNGVQIKSYDAATTQFEVNDQLGWYGSLESLSVEDMYMIKVKEPQTVIFKDHQLNPADYEFTLNKNWTWIGFPSSAALSIEHALGGITPVTGDVIKSQDAYAMYSQGIGWYGSLETMLPGEGYMYKNLSGTVKTLVYPEASNYRGEAPAANITAANNLMVPNMSKYANNMNITAVVNIDGEELMTEDFEVAVFAGNELRGSARPIYIESLNRYMLFITVYGEESEELTFKYYDLNSGEELNLFADSKVVFEINSIVGSLEQPSVLNYGTLSIDETSANSFNVYPNPVNRDNAISFETTFDKVEIYNSLGVVVAEYANVDQIDGIDAAGIYVIKVTNDNVVKYCRVIVK